MLPANSFIDGTNADMFGAQSQMNNQTVQMLNQNGFVDTGIKATLFLFSHRFIPDQWRRPYNYRFGGEFRNDLQQNLERAVGPQPYNQISAMMLDAPSARGAILPTAQGSHMNLKSFAENWTFVLVCDNDSGLTPMGLVNTLPSRMLYSGWIFDEPVTKTNMSGGYTLNPGAIYSTTHHTTLTVQTQLTPTGRVDHVDTNGDYDYISGTVAQNIQADGQALYELTPNVVASTIVEDPGNMQTFHLGSKPLTANPQAVELPTELNNPTHHLQQIVNNLGDAVRLTSTSTQADDVFRSKDVILANFASLSKFGVNTVLGGLDPSGVFTIKELQDKYGNRLNVVVCNQPHDLAYDITLPDTPTKRHVFTSILSNAMPSLLAQFGLAEIAFRYDSYQAVPGGLGSANGERGVFQLLNIATLYGASPDATSLAWTNLERYLKITLFPVLKANGGEFSLMMHCSLAGASLINLNFLDDIAEGGLIESNNLLGGLNTPMVGDIASLQNNAAQLYSVIKDTGVSSETSGNLGGYQPIPSSMY